MALIDLQAHSTVSDGQLEPADVARAAVEAGVTTMSLTDHDGIAGVTAATEVAEDAGILNVPGVEMSCVHKYSEDLHICGYWVDLTKIQPACDRAQQERIDRAKQIIAKLNEHGVEVTFEDAVAKAGAADAIGRPHIAKAAGAGPDLGPFFEEYLVPGAKAFVSRSWPSAEQAVELIHGAGGVAVVAHPYWDVKDPDQVRDLLRHRQSERAGKQADPSSSDALGTTASPDSTHARTPHERLGVLRRELNGLVAAWHHRTGQAHGITHAALRKECGGPAAAVATADQLQARIDRIREWAASRR